MRELILILHSFTRWTVLVASLTTALAALVASLTRRPWSTRDRSLARVFIACVDLQVLLGLSLYFAASPLAQAARALWAAEGFSALWAARELRFFGIIHPTLALLAACVAHAGWIASRRTDRAPEQHRRLGAAATLVLAIVLAAIPWPFLGHDRPWFRF
jgi:heme A synthase